MAETIDNHTEKHFTAGAILRDVIIGVSDGLTFPFAGAAGLSGANVGSSVIVIAVVATGAISMGLGGYLVAKNEEDQYHRELKREQEAKTEEDHYHWEMKSQQADIMNVPDTEAAEIEEILAQYELQPHEYAPLVDALRKKPLVYGWIL
ncbi:hypothetical protein MKW94_011614 [Papaver nudicaule]|uniref:Vacuolar iron transporter n=1 Tax=Papaver nudicaule TaxID=74823 RepID=A0AA41VRI4_PAPNU|nr:hypothetical protein [Papaver nudicaule]